MNVTAPRTYRASGNVVAAAGVAPFLAISGAAGRVIRITKVLIQGPTLTAAQFLRVALTKYSSAISAGTPVTPTKVPLDSAGPASLATINAYTAAPTPGAVVGQIAERTIIGQSTTLAPAAELDEGVFDFTTAETVTEFPTLRGIAENIGVSFAAAPASAVTLSYTIEYTEDGN